ncbi:tail completion protein gp17 [Sphingobium lignivorans]|uniref:DUF3168 domain-containing protein n=1 Tax=Sphingobium lignivorans TaxID=2735886 RepID=A0ABR6NJ42_9SPHN|nr:DUF3168 domain-containing protein [Sphingobium lignivorans]MBB5987297.1 hypothetical protein [Sphingobium lignivorans]
MSGAVAVRGAILAALRDDAALMALVNLVADGERMKASPPWLLVGDPAGTGWGARGVDGLALRQPLLLTVRSDDSVRMTSAIERIDSVLRAMEGDLGTWRITALNRARTSIAHGRTAWRASLDYAVRIARLH